MHAEEKPRRSRAPPGEPRALPGGERELALGAEPVGYRGFLGPLSLLLSLSLSLSLLW